MKNVILLLAIVLGGPALAQTYTYGAKVTLQGTLVSPEGFTPDEKKLTYPALQLAKPIAVHLGPESDQNFDEPERGVMLLHLVLDQPNRQAFKKLKGQRVRVEGSLFHSDNGHHQTDVLMDVKSMSPVK